MEDDRSGSVLNEGKKRLIYGIFGVFSGRVTSSEVVVILCFCLPHYSTGISNISL